MDPTSLLSIARARALEKKKARQRVEKQESSFPHSETSDGGNDPQVSQITEEAPSPPRPPASSFAAREQASVLLQKARSRVVTSSDTEATQSITDTQPVGVSPLPSHTPLASENIHVKQHQQSDQLTKEEHKQPEHKLNTPPQAITSSTVTPHPISFPLSSENTKHEAPATSQSRISICMPSAKPYKPSTPSEGAVAVGAHAAALHQKHLPQQQSQHIKLNMNLSHHTNLLWNLYSCLPVPPSRLLDDSSAQLFKDSFGLSATESNATAGIVQEMEACLQVSDVSSGVVRVFDKLLLFLSGDNNCSKLQLAIGASGGCQLVLKLLSGLCQRKRESGSSIQQELQLCLDSVLRLIKVNQSCILENFVIFRKNGMLDLISVIYKKYASSSQAICAALLSILEVVAHAEAGTFIENEALIEIVMSSTNNHHREEGKQHHDSFGIQSQGGVSTIAFGILSTLASCKKGNPSSGLSTSTESSVSVLLKCGLLEAVSSALDKVQSPRSVSCSSSEMLAASACEALSLVLAHNQFVDTVLSTHNLCDNVVATFLGFHNNSTEGVSGRLVKFTVLCIARLAGHSSVFGLSLLQNNTCNFLTEVWKSLFQYKADPDVLMPVLVLAVLLTDRVEVSSQAVSEKQQHQRDDRNRNKNIIPECVFGCVVDLLSTCADQTESRIITYFLVLNILKIGGSSVTSVYFEKYDHIGQDIVSLLQVLLPTESIDRTKDERKLRETLRKEIASYLLCAVSFLCCHDLSTLPTTGSMQQRLRRAGVGHPIELALTGLWEADKELHFFALQALCDLYHPSPDSDTDIGNDKLSFYSPSLMGHLVDLATGMNGHTTTSVMQNVFLGTPVPPCHLGTVVSQLFVNFSYFNNCNALFDEKICLLLFEEVKKKNKVSINMCVNLFALFRNMLKDDHSSLQFLEGSALKIVFDMLSGRSLDRGVCESGCRLLHRVVLSCRQKGRQVELEFNTFFMHNIINCGFSQFVDKSSTSSSTSASFNYFRSAVGVLNELAYGGGALSLSDQTDLQQYLLGALKNFRQDFSMLSVILRATKLLEVVFITPSSDICVKICDLTLSLIHQYLGNLEVCAQILEFLCGLSALSGGSALLEAFAERSEGVFVLLHGLSADGRQPCVRFLQIALQWLNTVCRQCPAVWVRVSHLNGCMVLLSLLDLATVLQAGGLAAEVTFAMKMMMSEQEGCTSCSTENQHSFRELNALQFLMQALNAEWVNRDDYGDIISENVFWAIHLLCDQRFRTDKNASSSGCVGGPTVPFIARNISQQLKHGMVHSPLAAAACAAVSSLCSISDTARNCDVESQRTTEIQQALSETGACQDIVAMLGLFKAEAVVVQYATLALASLTAKPSVNIDLVRGQSFYILLSEVLQDFDSSSEEICSCVMDILVNCEEDYESEIFHVRLVPKMYACMRIYSSSGLFFSKACKVLYSLTRLNLDAVQCVPLMDVVQVVSAGLALLEHDARACESACLAISNLVKNNPTVQCGEVPVLGLERLLMTVVDTHHLSSAAVGRSACLALCNLAETIDIPFSDVRCYTNVTLLLNQSAYESEDFLLFHKTLKIMTMNQFSEEENSTATKMLSSLRQTFVSKDNNVYLSALLALQSFSEQRLSCRLSLEQNDALEVLAEAVSVWREQPFLIATTLKAIHSMCYLEHEGENKVRNRSGDGGNHDVGVVYNMNVVHLLSLNIPELLLAVVMERWETAAVVGHGAALLSTCLRMDPIRFAADSTRGLCSTLNAILSRHVQLPEVVENVCALLTILAPQCAEFFVEVACMVPVVDALRVHLSRATGDGSSSNVASLRACETIATLLKLGEPSIATALGETEYLMLIVPALKRHCSLAEQNNTHIQTQTETETCHLFSVNALSTVRSLLDPVVGLAGAQGVGRVLVQLGGCPMLVDLLLLAAMRVSKGGDQVATLVCEIIFYMFYCNDKAGDLLNKLGCIATILKTARVFLNNAPLCEATCRCIRALSSVESSTCKKIDMCSFLVDVLKQHSQHSATSLASMTALADLAESDGSNLDFDVHFVFNTEVCEILGSALSAGSSPQHEEGAELSLVLLTSLWPALRAARNTDELLPAYHTSLVNRVMSSLNLYSNKPHLYVRVIALLSTMVKCDAAPDIFSSIADDSANNTDSGLFDVLLIDTLCQRLEEFCESDLLLLLSEELACEVASLLVNMCNSALWLRRLADSSICEHLTIAYDQLSDSSLFRRRCVTVWGKLVKHKVVFFCETHISYRLVAFLETHLSSEEMVQTVLRALLELLLTREGAEEFGLEDDVSGAVVEALLSSLITPRSAASGVRVMTALLQTVNNAGNRTFQQKLNVQLLSKFCLNALTLSTEELLASSSHPLMISASEEVFEAVQLATILTCTLTEPSKCFDYSQCCQQIMKVLPFLLAASSSPGIAESEPVLLSLSAFHSHLASFASCSEDMGHCLIDTGGKALVDHLTLCSAMTTTGAGSSGGFGAELELVEATWSLIHALMSRCTKKGAAFICNSAILENVIDNLDGFWLNAKTVEDSLSSGAQIVKASCNVLRLVLKEAHKNKITAAAAGVGADSIAALRLDGLMRSSLLCSKVVEVGLQWLTHTEVFSSCCSLAGALCSCYPDLIPTLLGKGMGSSLLLTGLETYIRLPFSSQRTVVLTLQALITSLIHHQYKEQFQPIFLGQRFRAVVTQLFQAYMLDHEALLEVCRAVTAIHSAGVSLPIDSPALIGSIAQGLVGGINASFLVLELLILMHSSVTAAVARTDLSNTRQMWRSQRLNHYSDSNSDGESSRDEDVLSTLLVVANKYSHVDTIRVHALNVIKELSVFDSSIESNVFTGQSFESLLALLKKTTSADKNDATKTASTTATSISTSVIISIAKIVSNVCSTFKDSIAAFSDIKGFELFQEQLQLYTEQKNREVVYEVLSAIVVCTDSDMSVCVDKRILESIIVAFDTDGLILSMAIRLQSYLQDTADGKSRPDVSCSEAADSPAAAIEGGVSTAELSAKEREKMKRHGPSCVTQARELLGLLKLNLQDGKIVAGLCQGLSEYLQKDPNVAAALHSQGAALLLSQALQLHSLGQRQEGQEGRTPTVLHVLDTVILLMSAKDQELTLRAFQQQKEVLPLLLREVLQETLSGEAQEPLQCREVTEKCLQAIALLSSLDECIDILKRSGIGQFALNCLTARCKSITAVQCSAASTIVYHLHQTAAITDTDHIQSLITPQVVAALVYLLDTHGGVGHAQCASSLLALLSLLSSPRVGVLALIAARAADHVVLPLSLHWEREDVVKGALQLLRNLSGEEESNPLQRFKTKEMCSVCLRILLHFQTYPSSPYRHSSMLENMFIVLLAMIKENSLLCSTVMPHIARVEGVLLACCVADGRTESSVPLMLLQSGLQVLSEVYRGVGHMGQEGGDSPTSSESVIHEILTVAFQQPREQLASAAGIVICDEVCRLITLLVNRSSEYQSLFGAVGLCDLLVVHLAGDHLSPSSMLLACEAMSSLASEHSNNIQTFHASGAVRMLASALRWHLDDGSDSEVAVGLGLLRVIVTLINKDEASALLYGALDFCQIVADIFAKYMSFPAAVKEIAALVCVLAHHQTANADNIVATSIPSLLSQSLVVHASDQETVQTSLCALWYTCRSMTRSASASASIRDLQVSKTIQAAISRRVDRRGNTNSVTDTVIGGSVGNVSTGLLGGEALCREGLGALLHVSLLEFHDSPPPNMHSFFINALSRHSDVELTKDGLEAIGRLCGVQHPQGCSCMLNLGVSGHIRSVLLAHQGSAEVIEACCHAVTALCQHEDGVVSLIQVGMIEMLCSTLSVFSEDSAAVCVATLQCLSAMLQHGYEDIAVDLLDRQIYHLSLQLVETHLSQTCMEDGDSSVPTYVVSLVEHVFRLIHALITIVPSCAAQFGLIGAVEVVLLAMQTQLAVPRISPALCLEALVLLDALCSERQNVTKVVLAGGFQTMLGLTRKVHLSSKEAVGDTSISSSTEVVCALAGVISRICTDTNTHCAQYQNSLGSCGACKMLLELLRYHTEHSLTLAELLRALTALSVGNTGNLQVVMSRANGTAELLPLVFSSLSNSSSCSGTAHGSVDAACSLVVVLASSAPVYSDTLGMAGLCDSVVDTLQQWLHVLPLPLLQCANALMKDNMANQTAFGRNKNFFAQLKHLLNFLSSTGAEGGEASAHENSVALLAAAAWSISLLGRCCSVAAINADNCRALFKNDLHNLLITAVQRHNSFAAVAEAGCNALAQSVGGLTPKQVSAVGTGGGCEIVMNSLLQHRGDLMVVEAALSALATLTNSPDNVALLKALGIVDVLAKLHVFSLSENISAKAPSALKNLCLDADMSDAFGRLHICSELESVFMQCEYTPPACSGASGEAVRVMLLDLTTCVSNLLLSGPHTGTYFLTILPKLIELLLEVKKVSSLCDDEMVAVVCSVLTSLLQNEQLTAELISSSHLCECLAEVFTHFAQTASVTLAIAKVIIVLCLKHDFSVTFVELDILSQANALIHEVSEADTAQLAALNQLLRVLSCDTDVRVDIGLRGDSSTVASLLSTHIGSEGTTLKNLDILKKLVHKNTGHIHILIEFGICNTLLDILRKYTKNTDILVESMLIILFMVKNSDKMAAGLEVSGGIEVVVGSLRRYTFLLFESPSTLRLMGLTLRVVYEFATSTSRREKFQAAGAPEVITEIYQAAINRWDEGLIMWCNSAAYRLCSGSTANQEAFGVSGVCLCVSSVLSKYKELKNETIEAVLLALIFLSRTNTNSSSAGFVTCENMQNVTAFFNLQCDRNVCRILSEMNEMPDVMRVTCNAVFILGRDAESVQRLAALGAAELISDVLIKYSSQDTPDFIDVALVAMSVIEPLIAYPGLIARFADKAVLSYCLDLLEQHQELFSSSQLEKVCGIISQFARWKEEYVSKMMDRKVCELLVTAYTAQSEGHVEGEEEVCAEVAVAFSDAIAALCSSEEATSRLLQLAASDLLISLLGGPHGGDERASSAACAALAELSTHQDFGAMFIRATCCSSVEEEEEEGEEEGRYIPVVSTLRRFITVKPVIDSCFNILINIYKHAGHHADAHTTLLMQAHLCELLPEILRKHSESAVIVAKCSMVMSMLCLVQKAADVLVSCGANEAIIKALDLFSNDGEVAQYGCKFIRNLACFAEYRDLLVASPRGMDVLLRVFDRHHKTKRVLIEVCAALVNLHGCDMKTSSNPNPSASYVTSTSRSHTDVKQYLSVIAKALALHVDSGALVTQICCLVRILAEDELNRGPLGAHGVCRHLEAALDKHVASPRVADKILAAIARVAGGSVENCAAFGSTRALSILLVDAWSAHKQDKLVVENCCWAIMSMLSFSSSSSGRGGGNENVQHFRGSEVAAVLVESLGLHAGDAAVCAMVCQAATAVGKEKHVLGQMCALGLTTIASKLFRTFVSLPSIRHVSNTLAMLCSPSSCPTAQQEVTTVLQSDMAVSLSQALVIHKSSEVQLIAVCTFIATFVRMADSGFAASLVNQYSIMDTLNFILDKHQRCTGLLLVVSDMIRALADKEVSLELTSPSLVAQVVTSVNDHKHDKNLVVQYCNVLAGILCGKQFSNLPINAEVCGLLSSLIGQYRQDEHVIQAVARVTEAFAQIDANNADLCAHSQLFGHSLRLLKAHMNSEGATVALLRALIAMNYSRLNIKHFINIDVLELLHYILTKHLEGCPALISASCDLISQIVTDSADVKKVCSDAKFCTLVVRALQLHVHDAVATAACCASLRVLCVDHEANVQRVIEQGVGDILAHTLLFHREVSSTFTSVSGLITLLVEASQDFLATMVSLDIRAILVPALGFFSSLSSNPAIAASGSCLLLLRRLYELQPGLATVDYPDECAHVTTVMRACTHTPTSVAEGSASVSHRHEHLDDVMHNCCALVYYLANCGEGTHQEGNNAKEFGALGACELVATCLSQASAASPANMDFVTLSLFTVIALIGNDHTGQNHYIFVDQTEVCKLVSFVMKSMVVTMSEKETAGDLATAALNTLAVLTRSSSSESDSRNVDLFVHEDLCEVLIDYLGRHRTVPNVVYFSCEAMFNLSQNSSRACQRFIACRALSHVANILQSYTNNGDIIACAQGVLFHLSSPSACDKNNNTAVMLEEFCSYGILDALISSIDTVSSNSDIVLFSIQTVENLARHVDILPRLSRAGACIALNRALCANRRNVSIVCSVLSVMQTLMKDNTRNQQEFFSDDMEVKLIKIGTKIIVNKNDPDLYNIHLLDMIFSALVLLCGQMSEQEGDEGGGQRLLQAGVLDLIALALASELVMQSLPMFVVTCTLLTDLLEQNLVREHDLNSAQICEMIASSLGAHRANAEALDVSCRALSRLKLFLNGGTGGGCEESLFSDASQHVLTRLQQDPTVDRESALQYCHAVHALVNLQEGILDSGELYSKLVAILHTFPNDDELMVESTRTVCTLAKEGGVNVDAIVCRDSGLVSALIKTFQGCCRSRRGLGKELCDTMSLLLVGEDINMLILFSQTELCTSLCHYLAGFYQDISCVSAVCRLGEHLCRQLTNRKSMCSSGMSKTLLLVVKAHMLESKCLLSILDLALAFTFECQDNISHLASAEFCSCLVELFRTEKYSAHVPVLSSCLRLVCVLASNRTVRLTLGRAGVCGSLVTVGQQHQDVDQLLTSTLHAVRTLSSNCVENKYQFGEAGCCQFLTSLLQERQSKPTQCELICSAIASLLNSKSPDNPNVARFEQARFIPVLADVFQACGKNTDIVKHLFIIVKCLAAASIGLSFTLRDHDILGKSVLLGQMYCASPLSLAVCECLRALAQNKENKYALGSCGACKVLTSIVRYAVDAADGRLVEEALLTVAALVRGSYFNQGLFGTAGLCPLLAQLVAEDSGSGVGIEEKALWCISLLARSDVTSNTSNESNILLFSDSGVMDSLLYIFRSPDQRPLLRAASWTLRNMCFMPAHAQYFLAKGGYTLLLGALQDHFHDVDVCEAICYALPALLSFQSESAGAGGGDDVDTVETCELLVPVLSSHINVETIVNRISSSLSILCARSVQARQYLGAKGVCTLLTRALRTHLQASAEVVEELCGAMWNLSMDNADNRARLGHEGACELILDALRYYSANKYVVDAATGCLVALSEDNPENVFRLDTYKRKVVTSSTSGSLASSATGTKQQQAGGQSSTSQAKAPHRPQIINSE